MSQVTPRSLQRTAIAWKGAHSTAYVELLIPPARGPGTLIPSAQRLVWAAKQLLGNAALGALFA